MNGKDSSEQGTVYAVPEWEGSTHSAQKPASSWPPAGRCGSHSKEAASASGLEGPLSYLVQPPFSDSSITQPPNSMMLSA